MCRALSRYFCVSIVVVLSISFVFSQSKIIPPKRYSLNTLPQTLKIHFPDKFAQGKGFFSKFDSDLGLAMDLISFGSDSAMCDSKGNLWFGTWGGGISKYDGKTFTTYSTEDGLVNNIVLCVFEDSKGNIWFGTNEGGVSKYDGKSFMTFNTESGLVDNRIIAIEEDDNGNLWFGSWGGGLSKFDGKQFSNYKTSNGLPSDTIFSILKDHSGKLWFGTDG